MGMTWGVGVACWVGPDRELGERVVGSFLLGLKRQLVEWGFGRKEVNVDLGKSGGAMKVGKQDVLSVGVMGGRLRLTWENETWGKWQDLLEAKEFKELVGKAEEKLGRAGLGGKAKGKGGKE